MKAGPTILFIGRRDDKHCSKALRFCSANFADVQWHLGDWGDPRPADLSGWEGDIIMSYLSRWVLPEKVLQRAHLAAINFHPGTPEYPGIGCYNLALYKGATEYGVTCHHMHNAVDSGPIIAVRRFPVFPNDTVASLISRTYDHQLELFYEIAHLNLAGKELPTADEQWARAPMTRADLNELSKVRPDMSDAEIARRVRATTYGSWKPTVELGGFTFELRVPESGEGQ